MKHENSVPMLLRRLLAISFAVLLLGPAVAQAAECPDESPEDAQERRTLAKEWFSTAETAENAGDDVEATRAYACSYKMVPHPYTAFNLARVSERAGDTELSLKMYKAYLALKPDARDKEEVAIKIKALEDRLTAASQPEEPTSPIGLVEEEPLPPEPIPEEPKDELTPPPLPKPADIVTRPAVPEPEPGSRSYLVEWIVGGAAAGALVGAIATNFVARAKMDSCRTNANNELWETANDECNAARPMAYTSYVLFGVAAAGIATDAVLLIMRHKGDSSSSEINDPYYGLMLFPGGAGLSAQGRF
jgi:hypothetical protein